jgi:GNAT superfamily N-acetyltransferase
MMTSTLALPEATAADRFQILPSGIKIARLGAGDQGWLVEFRQILEIAAADFLRRAHQAGTPTGVIDDLAHALEQPHQAVWVVVDPAFRLRGFALAEIRTGEFGCAPRAFVPAAYLYPRRTPRAVFPALVQAILAWAAPYGATSLDFQTRRPAARAWRRVGATPAATLYTVPIPQTGV